MSFRLAVPRALFAAMLEQAHAELPNECCGFLAGTIEGEVGRVVARYPLVNELASPIEFSGEARSQFEAWRDMRRQGIEVLAIYHSHPTSAPVPSRKDLDNHFWGEEVMCVIISLVEPEPAVRAWWLTVSDYRVAEWKIVE